MPRLHVKAPAYLRHSASGEARVRIGGRDIYLGPYGTAASKREYDRVIAEWLANAVAAFRALRKASRTNSASSSPRL